jgi:hypothetical protein
MKAEQPTFRLIRRGGRKKSRVKIGWRVFAIYIIAVLATGAVAISLNLKVQDWEKTHTSQWDDP